MSNPYLFIILILFFALNFSFHFIAGLVSLCTSRQWIRTWRVKVYCYILVDWMWVIWISTSLIAFTLSVLQISCNLIVLYDYCKSHASKITVRLPAVWRRKFDKNQVVPTGIIVRISKNIETSPSGEGFKSYLWGVGLIPFFWELRKLKSFHTVNEIAHVLQFSNGFVFDYWSLFHWNLSKLQYYALEILI